jgi:hypothetical protein
MRIPCATPDLMQQLQHTKRRQIKHLKQASEIPAKMPKNTLKTIANICNI